MKNKFSTSNNVGLTMHVTKTSSKLILTSNKNMHVKYHLSNTYIHENMLQKS